MRQMLGADEYHLYVEAPYQPQHTLKSMLIDPGGAHDPLTFEWVREWARRVLPHIDPLRWQLAGRPIGLGHRFLLDRPDLDLDYHVQRATAAAPGGRDELGEVLSRIMSGPLDRARPLWQLWWVDGLADDQVALVWKLHHALADGGGCVELFDAAFQHDADERPELPEQLPPEDPRPDRIDLVRVGWHTIPPRVKKFPGLVYRSLRAARIGARRRKEGIPGPARPFEAPETRLNRPFTPNRLCVWTSLPFEDVTAVRKALDCTVNDVFVAVCAGAIREYLDRHGELPEKSLTTNIPVSIRGEHERGAFGNRVSVWYVSLATDLADPVERLQAVKAHTRAARAHSEARASERLLFEWQDYDWLFKPFVMMGHVSTRLAKRPAYNTIVSNVRGPNPLWLDGAEILEIQSMGQLASGLGLNLTSWTYRGQMNVGLVACPEHVPDLWTLADGLAPALTELKAAALVHQAEVTATTATA